MAVALAAVVALAPTLAYAGSPFGGGKGIRTPRIGNVMGGGRSGMNISGLSRGIGRSNGFSGLSRGLSGLGGSNLGRLGSSNRNHWNSNGSSGLFGSRNNFSGFGGFGGGYGSGWGGGYHHSHNDFADAYRDVGIATAAVGLVGIIANVAANADQRYVTPVPVAVPAPAPAGYWARQAVVVQPERYEQYQEWIPELYDSRTGQKIGGGYYESRTRLVPQVVEHRDVWVTR